MDADFLCDEAAMLGGVIRATSVRTCTAADTYIDKLIYVWYLLLLAVCCYLILL